MQKKIQNFSALEPSLPDPRNSPPLQLSGYAPESNHTFAELISLPPEFSLMPRLQNINFNHNKPKIKLILQKIKIFEI